MQVTIACDEDIVNMLKNRDRKAMVLLLGRYGKELYSFVYHRLNSEELTEATLKKTFAAIWNASQNYNKPPEHFFIWLLRIAQQNIDEVCST